MNCPHCYSEFITLIQFEAEVFECRECRKISTPEEVEAADVRSLEQVQRSGVVLARSADILAFRIALRMQEQAGLDFRESFILARQEVRQARRLDWMGVTLETVN